MREEVQLIPLERSPIAIVAGVFAKFTGTLNEEDRTIDWSEGYEA